MRSTITLLLTASLIVSAAAAKAQNAPEGSSTLAPAWSLLVPGIVQHSAGQHGKALAMEGGYVLGALLYLNSWETWGGGYDQNEASQGYYYYNGYESAMGTAGYVGIGLMLGSVTWSFVDALSISNDARSAKVESEPKASFGHLVEVERGGRVVGLDVGSRGAQVTLHF